MPGIVLHDYHQQTKSSTEISQRRGLTLTAPVSKGAIFPINGNIR
jgi:hypothetical protein